MPALNVRPLGYADALLNPASHAYGGGVVGVDGWFSDGFQLGTFIGGLKSDLDTARGNQSLDADTVFGGFYANLTANQSFLRFMISGGHSQYESGRQVADNLAANGTANMIGAFDGAFVSPELAIGVTLDMGGLTVEPSARLRYAHLSLDGYTETGGAAPLNVGERDVSAWLGRAQLAFPMATSTGTVTPRIGVEAWGSDGDVSSVSLLGNALTFSAGDNDEQVTGYLGVTASTELGDGFSAFLDAEVHANDDGIQRHETRGGLRLRF